MPQFSIVAFHFELYFFSYIIHFPLNSFEVCYMEKVKLLNEIFIMMLPFA